MALLSASAAAGATAWAVLWAAWLHFLIRCTYSRCFTAVCIQSFDNFWKAKQLFCLWGHIKFQFCGSCSPVWRCNLRQTSCHGQKDTAVQICISSWLHHRGSWWQNLPQYWRRRWLLLSCAGIWELECEFGKLSPASGERELRPWQQLWRWTHPALSALPRALLGRGKVSLCEQTEEKDGEGGELLWLVSLLVPVAEAWGSI